MGKKKNNSKGRPVLGKKSRVVRVSANPPQVQTRPWVRRVIPLTVATTTSPVQVLASDVTAQEFKILAIKAWSPAGSPGHISAIFYSPFSLSTSSYILGDVSDTGSYSNLSGIGFQYSDTFSDIPVNSGDTPLVQFSTATEVTSLTVHFHILWRCPAS